MSNNKDRNLVDMNTGILPTEDEIYAQADKAGISISAAGSSLKSVTVTSYSGATNTGTGTYVYEAGTVTFINGTGVYLGVGDVVAVATDADGNNVAVALISRAGAVTPGVLLPVYPNTSFPIRLDNLAYPMWNKTPNSNNFLSYDYFGALGTGTETIVGAGAFQTASGGSGYTGSVGKVRALNVTSRSNSEFGTYNAGTVDYYSVVYVQRSGNMFVISTPFSGGNTLYFRNYSTGTYTTVSSAVTSWAYDKTSEVLFYRVGSLLYSWANGATSGTSITTSFPTITLLCADNGYVVGTIGSNLYKKNAGDSSDWVLVYTGATLAHAVDTSGRIYAHSVSGGLITFTKYTATNIASVQQTSIASATAGVEQLLVTAGGGTVFTVRQRADILIPGQSSSSYGIGLYQFAWDTVYPAANTSLLVADVTMVAAPTILAPVNADSLQQITSTSFMWGQTAGGLYVAYRYSF